MIIKLFATPARQVRKNGKGTEYLRRFICKVTKNPLHLQIRGEEFSPPLHKKRKVCKRGYLDNV